MNRILFIMFKYFNQDPRPQREAAALIDQGFLVDVICLSPSDAENKYENSERLRFFTVPVHKKRKNQLRYLYEYTALLGCTFSVAAWLYFRNRYKMVQIFVMPEILMFSGVIPKLLGARLLMDWEDPSFELYLTKFKTRYDFIFLALIRLIEKLSVALADKIITPNEGFKQAFSGRGFRSEKIDIVMNSPDRRIFDKVAEQVGSSEKRRFTVLYNGTILMRHGLDVAIRAFKIVTEKIPDARMVIIGDGESDYVNQCRAIAEQENIAGKIDWRGFVNIDQIPDIIRQSSVVVIPNRKTEFTVINFPQRILECGYLRVPLVVSRLPGIEYYMNDESICFFEPENYKNLAEKIISLHTSPLQRQTLIENAFQLCKNLTWEPDYKKVVNELTGERVRAGKTSVSSNYA